MKKLEDVFEKELVEAWGDKLPEYASRVLELLDEKQHVAEYEIIGYVKHYNSGYMGKHEAEINNEMLVFYCKKESKLYGSFQYNTQRYVMIDLQSVNCVNGVVDTYGSISRPVNNIKVISYRPKVSVEFMQDFSCKKRENIPYYTRTPVDTFQIFELKKQGGKGKFIAKSYSYDDAIDIMKGSDAEMYLVYINGDPNVFYKDVLLQNDKEI